MPNKVRKLWQQRLLGVLNTRMVVKQLEDAVKTGSGTASHTKGDVAATEAAGQTVEAWYSARYFVHATMEPMNCTGQVKDGKVQVWVSTQVPGMARAVAAHVAVVGLADVTVHVTLLGGGFGRRLESDYVAQAVRVAMDCGGEPVQLAWPREEDATHDFYRPMHVARLRAVVDGKGSINSLCIKPARDAIKPRWFECGLPMLAEPVESPDKTTAEGLFDLPYNFTHQRMQHVTTRVGVLMGFWRSLEHSHNAFFTMSVLDELALAANQDPLRFRRELLEQAPRYLTVLNLGAEKAGWWHKLPESHAHRQTPHQSFGSIVAQVAQVAQVSLVDGKPRVHRVVCAVDCGTVVYPDIVTQQVESAVVYDLTAALFSNIDICDSVVRQNDSSTYPMLQLEQTPYVETFIVPSKRPPAKVGEPGLPLMVPAVADALYLLSGQQVRALPIGRRPHCRTTFCKEQGCASALAQKTVLSSWALLNSAKQAS